ncbi:MAG: hypothetical protein KDA71_20315, partial [Planctomycetales bacterium]|nr:hypothetical protein [Planctomycetales bacterium]
FDFKTREPRFFDATRFSYLSFWVRGERGGERFAVKLADRNWAMKEDSISMGDVDVLLPGGVTTNWQRVTVPLGADPRLKWSELAGVTFDFNMPGQYVVHLDDVYFHQSADDPAPANTDAATQSSRTPSPPRAMWIWNTEPLLVDAAQRNQLWEFCDQHRIDTLWIQLLYESQPESRQSGTEGHDDENPATPRRLRYEVQWRSVLREAHRRGIKVHGLDGLPEWALREFHSIPLSIVDCVITFNQRQPEEARFDGVHFDNEPHLLIGWHEPERREEILREFLELNAACQLRCDHHPELEFGVDIPFWWQYKDDQSREPIGVVSFNGKRQAADRHCIDMLDNVGVMNYRDTADGADGMIAHGRDLLRYADEANGAKLFLGVETFAYQPTEVWFLLGPPRDRFMAALDGPAGPLARRSRLKQQRLRLFDDGRHMHVGIELPINADEAARQEAARVLTRLAPYFADRSVAELASVGNTDLNNEGKGDASADKPLSFLISRLNRDPEWRSARAFPIRVSTDASAADSGESPVRPFPGIMAESVMMSKITFADDSPEEMFSQIGEADEYFAGHRSYAGIAIHYYETFRRLTQAAR